MNLAKFINQPIIITPLRYKYEKELKDYKIQVSIQDKIYSNDIIKIINNVENKKNQRAAREDRKE